MLPLALAGPAAGDPARPRRAAALISFLAAAGAGGRRRHRGGDVESLLLFPLALAILVASKVHAITKNGLTMAYADPDEGLMQANARLGRVAAAGALSAAPFGFVLAEAVRGSGAR